MCPQKEPKKPQARITLVDYADCVEKGRKDVMGQLAELTMVARVDFETGLHGGKKEVYWHKNRKTVAVAFTLTQKNFAAVQLTVQINGKDWNSSPKGYVAAPGKESTGSPSEHAERFALAYAINEAIDAEWKPKFKGKELKNLEIPPRYEDLQKFTDALKDTSIILFTEKSFCSKNTTTIPQGEIGCDPALTNILTGKKHEVYYAVAFGNKQGEKDIRNARNKYYKKTDYEDEKKFLSENSKAKIKVEKDHERRFSVGAKKGNQVELSSESGEDTSNDETEQKTIQEQKTKEIELEQMAEGQAPKEESEEFSEEAVIKEAVQNKKRTVGTAASHLVSTANVPKVLEKKKKQKIEQPTTVLGSKRKSEPTPTSSEGLPTVNVPKVLAQKKQAVTKLPMPSPNLSSVSSSSISSNPALQTEQKPSARSKQEMSQQHSQFQGQSKGMTQKKNPPTETATFHARPPAKALHELTPPKQPKSNQCADKPPKIKKKQLQKEQRIAAARQDAEQAKFHTRPLTSHTAKTPSLQPRTEPSQKPPGRKPPQPNKPPFRR